ncbi:caspase family protein [Constrictibacter sp. MBR-5]|jgi:hypothetical protein|uniref:caspase family protein n=1 Tax=Constrictibacter sp. MBR-5 TaxID=3156467 RepID=UPI003394325F
MITTSQAGAQQAGLHKQVSQNRIALLVGNDSYVQENLQPGYSAFRPLNNPCNDITRISAQLELAGWNPETEILSTCNATKSEIRDKLDRFVHAYLSDAKSFGFIFYAGHGMQVGNDTYLFGIDAAVNAKAAAEALLRHPGGSVLPGGLRLFGDIISQVGDAGSGSIFIVIDACRETPIDRYIRKDGSLVKDYAKLRYAHPRSAVGVRLMFSTAYGALASDGSGSGSPFAVALETHLKEEGRVELLISRVVKAVSDDTQDAKIRQIPDAIGALNPPPPEACLTYCGAAK